MGGTGIIDQFLETFTRYINSGFGLLGGEVGYLATTLAAIDVTLAGLFWAWGADEDILARLVRKTLFVGVFAFLIGNWNSLARIIFESFAGLGLKASGTGLSSADFLRPGKIAQVGLDAGRPILDSISEPDGLCQLLREFRPDRGSAVCLDRGAARLLYSGDPALHHPDRVQADDARGLRADPVRAVRQDRLCRRARARQRDFVGRQGSGAGRHRRHRLDAVLRSSRRALVAISRPSINAMALVLGALSLLGLGIFGPGIANGIVSGGPQLGAGAAVGTGLAAGGAIVAGAGLAAGGAGLAGGALLGGARGAATVASGTASAYRAGGLSGVASAGGSAIVSPLRRMAAGLGSGSPAAEAPPAWARRMKRAQTVNQGVSAATHAVRSGDGAGGGVLR